MVRGEGTEKKLVAYLILNGTEAFSIHDLRSYMKDSLPEYMVIRVRVSSYTKGPLPEYMPFTFPAFSVLNAIMWRRFQLRL